MTTSLRGKRALATSFLIALLSLPSALRAEEKQVPKKPAAGPPPPQRVAPRSADAIAYLFHGEYMNADGQKIKNPSPAAIEAFRAGKTRARAVANPRDQAAYCAACLKAGVPEPPSFSSGKWQSKGSLAKNSQFTSQNVKDILVYESAKPPGVCVALPRGEGDDIELDGVICQGKESGKACFWDNIDSSSGNRIVESDFKNMDIAKFQNGDQLDEDCTNCHRGDNVYLIHDELSQIPLSDPDKRYEPIPTGPHTDGSFWNNPGRGPNEKNLMREEGCGECHKMPAMSLEYCSSVLSPAITTGYMPQSGKLDETDRDKLTCRDVCLLHYECIENGAAGLPDQADAGICNCDERWWPELKKIPPKKANPN